MCNIFCHVHLSGSCCWGTFIEAIAKLHWRGIGAYCNPSSCKIGVFAEHGYIFEDHLVNELVLVLKQNDPIFCINTVHCWAFQDLIDINIV